MTFNEEELIRIRDATRGFLKKRVRQQIAIDLVEIEAKITSALSGSEDEFVDLLRSLLKEATIRRKFHLACGASSYSHPGWAAAAACESYLHELLTGDVDSSSRVQGLVHQLITRK